MDNYTNKGITCDVYSCQHNCDGCKCKLDNVKITKDCTNCTCCDSFVSKPE